MPITKQKAIEACYDKDKTVVHDEKERGRLLEFLDRLPDEKPAQLAILRADSANEAIVEYLRVKMAAAQPGAAQAAGVLQRVQRVERVLRRQRYSLTDARTLGADIIEQAQDQSSTSQTLQGVLSVLAPPINEELPDVLDDLFKEEWASATREGQLQPLAVKAVKVLTNEMHKILDTSTSGYYKNPTAKIDISLSHSFQAYWPTFIAPIELKLKLDGTSHQEGVGQLQDRWEKVQEMQPTRQLMIGCLLGQDSIELWRFQTNGICKRTNILPFSWERDNIGYQVLVRFLRAPSANLGFQPLHSPAGFRTAMGKKVRLAAAMSSVGVRPVYVASYGRERAVVKMSSQADHDREVEVLELEGIKGKRGFPCLREHGELPEHVQAGAGATHYMVITPVGVHLGDEHRDGAVLITIRDVADAVRHLAKHSWLHRDISPSNIVVAKLGNKTQGVLLDYHVAGHMGGSPGTGHRVTGKPVYHALRLRHSQEHSVAADLESLFYSLLDVLSGGEALWWRRCIGERNMYSAKFAAMFSEGEWCRVLGACRPSLQPVLAALHKVIFRDSPDHYVRHPVTVEEFVEALQH